jgi:hypothetical protein
MMIKDRLWKGRKIAERTPTTTEKRPDKMPFQTSALSLSENLEW